MARIITPEAQLSYPNVFEPRAANEDAQPKYSVSLVFSPDADISELEKAAAAVLVEKFGKKKATPLLQMVQKRKKDPENFPGTLTAGGLRWPFRTDWAEKGYPEGSTFLNVRSERAPQVVSIVPDENGRPSVVTDHSKVYPGVVAKASVDPYTYDVSGNKGVTFGLGNIQILRDGERLDGMQHATDEFEADPDAVPDLSDLTEEDEGEETEEPEAEEEGETEDDDLSDLLP